MEIKGVIYDGKHEAIIDIETFNKVQKMFNYPRARSHNVEFAYIGLLTCGHCGCQMTAELKKGKYVYYHCTGKRGGNCKKDYIREEQLDKVFMELINKLPNPNDRLFEDLKIAIKEVRKLKSEYEGTSLDEISKQIARLNNRLEKLYEDKVDGIISREYWQEKHNEWHAEKDNLINKLKVLSSTAKNFDEGSNLLEKLGSNFFYKDKKVSVVLTSVFDYILNNRFVYYGGG